MLLTYRAIGKDSVSGGDDKEQGVDPGYGRLPSPGKRGKSHCVLLYGPDLTHEAAERLKVLRATRDGFLVAEKDLALRGPGEVLGVRQKGYLEGRCVLSVVFASITCFNNHYPY